MGFNDWIRITPAPMALDARLDEIDNEAKSSLARDIQTRLRGRIDPGIDLSSARRAQTVRVTAKGGSLVIDEQDQGSVLRGGMPQRDISKVSASGIADLFTMSSGVPEVERDPDGSNRLVFRTISADRLFAEQEQGEQNRVVQETVTETLRMGIVDSYETAVSEVERRYPEDRQE